MALNEQLYYQLYTRKLVSVIKKKSRKLFKRITGKEVLLTGSRWLQCEGVVIVMPPHCHMNTLVISVNSQITILLTMIFFFFLFRNGAMTYGRKITTLSGKFTIYWKTGSCLNFGITIWKGCMGLDLPAGIFSMTWEKFS